MLTCSKELCQSAVRQCELQPAAQYRLLMSACLTQGKIKSLEQIYLFSMPVKEYQIVEAFLGTALKDEVMKIMPVQKQTRAGQRTRFKVSSGCFCQEFLLSLANATVQDMYASTGRPDTSSFVLQAFVVVGDHNGHVGLGVKCAKEVRQSVNPQQAPFQLSSCCER